LRDHISFRRCRNKRVEAGGRKRNKISGSEVSVKFTLQQTMKAQRWSRGVPLLFFNLDFRLGWGVNASGSVTPGKGTRYPLHRKGVGSQGQPRLVQKILLPLGFHFRTFQPVMCLCTDYGSFKIKYEYACNHRQISRATV
jgi:hypothetical protein